MPLHNYPFLQITFNLSTESAKKDGWLEYLISVSPVISLLVSISNLLLVAYVFRFTRRKNDRDRNIKWFQDLIYSPNKEIIAKYFDALRNLKDKIPQQNYFTEQIKIDLMDELKEERNKFMGEFVDVIKLIAPSVHKEIYNTIDNLTDELTNVLDNDELKLQHPKTQQREIIGRIQVSRNKVYAALFNYKG